MTIPLNVSSIVNYVIMSLILVAICWTGANTIEQNKQTAVLANTITTLNEKICNLEDKINSMYTQKEAEREFSLIYTRLEHLEENVFYQSPPQISN